MRSAPQHDESHGPIYDHIGSGGSLGHSAAWFCDVFTQLDDPALDFMRPMLTANKQI